MKTTNNFQCCHDTKEWCQNTPTFEIRCNNRNNRTDVDNYTYSCGKHLEEMLGWAVGYPKCESWTVTLMHEEK